MRSSLGYFSTRDDQDPGSTDEGATRVRGRAAPRWIGDVLIQCFQQVTFASAASQALVRSENGFAHGHVL